MPRCTISIYVKNMPCCCCVPLCKSNYKNRSKVSCFSFPTNEFIKKQWLLAIRRQGFVPSKHSRVCELHFKSSDIVYEASAFDEEKGILLTVPLKVKRLRPYAVPSIFSHFPIYDEQDKAKHISNINQLGDIIEDQSNNVQNLGSSLIENQNYSDVQNYFENSSQDANYIEVESITQNMVNTESGLYFKELKSTYNKSCIEVSRINAKDQDLTVSQNYTPFQNITKNENQHTLLDRNYTQREYIVQSHNTSEQISPECQLHVHKKTDIQQKKAVQDCNIVKHISSYSQFHEQAENHHIQQKNPVQNCNNEEFMSLDYQLQEQQNKIHTQNGHIAQDPPLIIKHISSNYQFHEQDKSCELLLYSAKGHNNSSQQIITESQPNIRDETGYLFPKSSMYKDIGSEAKIWNLVESDGDFEQKIMACDLLHTSGVGDKLIEVPIHATNDKDIHMGTFLIQHFTGKERMINIQNATVLHLENGLEDSEEEWSISSIVDVLKCIKTFGLSEFWTVHFAGDSTDMCLLHITADVMPIIESSIKITQDLELFVYFRNLCLEKIGNRLEFPLKLSCYNDLADVLKEVENFSNCKNLQGIGAELGPETISCTMNEVC